MSGQKLPDPDLFRLIFDHLKAFAILDTDARYIYVNKAWEEISGYTFEEAYGRRVEEIFPDTHSLRAMQTGENIVARPVIDRDGQQQYTTYTPIFRDGVLMGCAIQTPFSGYNEALEFSYTLSKMQRERNYYRQELSKLRGAKYSLDNIIGESPKIKELRRKIQQAARSTSNVLLQGETGTGKELVAHSLHDLSARYMNPFIKVNCAAIPEELAESELFGYEYGAFTGAKKGGNPGKFEFANSGSLFLDEINHLSSTIQPKLLRVLQEQEIERIGNSRSIPVDVRLITAANVPLWEQVEKGLFRKDLYYRLNVINIELPPLRDRLEDIPLLANYIIAQLNEQMGTKVEGISADSLRYLQEYDWPGNIRELQNVLERAMNIRLNGLLLWADLADSFKGNSLLKIEGVGTRNGAYRDIKNRVELKIIEEMLENCGGNKKLTAERLGISRTLLYRKLKQYGIGH